MAVSAQMLLRRGAPVAGFGMAGVAAATVGMGVGGLATLVRPARSRPEPQMVDIVDVADGGDGTVRLTVGGPQAALPGTWGLNGPDVAVLIGPPRTVGGGTAVRDARVLHGHLAPGDRLGLSSQPWGDRADLLGLHERQWSVDGPVGSLPVTELTRPGTQPGRAVVYVHGRGSSRMEGLWLAPSAADAGWRTVLVGYRNDPDAPATGRYLLGGEWEDLQAVLKELRADGVGTVVLVGWSMGGNIAASYLRHVDDDQVAGLVLDAPALDWAAILGHIARSRRLPRQLVPAVMWTGRMLTGIDWMLLNHVADPSHLDMPVLAFHGTDDEVVPDAVSVELARRLPDVQLQLVAGAGHCRSVNTDPAGYLDAFARFLRRVG